MENARKRSLAAVLAFVMLFASVFADGTIGRLIQAAEPAAVAAWEFTEGPENGLPVSATAGTGTLDVSGASYTGYSTQSICANNWQENGYWQITADAVGYENLTFSASMRSSNTGPANFVLEYSLDEGSTWTAVEQGAVTVASTRLSSYYDGLALPSDLADAVVMLRVRMEGTTSLNGGTVAQAGTSNINNIVLSGTAITDPTDPSDPSDPTDPVYDPVSDEMIASVEGAISIADVYDESVSGTVTAIGQVVYAYAGSAGGDLINILLEDVVEGEIVGLQIYDYTNESSYRKGDIVAVTGTKGAYGGVTQISNVTEIQVLGSAEAIAPQEKTIAELMAGGDAFLSEYVLIRDVVLGGYNASGNTTVTDATGSIGIYKGAAYPDGVAEGDTVDLLAAFSKYNATYQLRNAVSEDYVTDVTPGEGIVVDDSVVTTLGNWIGNGPYAEGQMSILDSINGYPMTAANADGTPIVPFQTTAGSTGTNYYMGASPLPAGSYMQMDVSSEKYGALVLNFQLRATSAAAKSYDIQYSTDGSTFVTAQTVTLSASGQLEPFAVTLPDGAANAEQLIIRLTAGTSNFSGGTASGGNVRFLNVTLTGSPIVSDSICGIVKVSPEAGEVLYGTELTMSCATEGASIYYSLDGGTVLLYDETAKPVLTQFPCNVTVYAAKEGLSDSVPVTYAYTQAQVSAVKAAPNGGAVSLNTKVTLSCATEGASILYSLDEGETWNVYDEAERLTLTELPISVRAKAEKEGYADSAVSTFQYTLRQNEKYNIYFGQLHSHTSYSDGAGSCEEAFVHASGVDNLDFLAVTDHSNSFDNANQADIADGSVSSEWVEGHALAEQYTTDTFVCLFGYEMTWSNGLGHMNTFHTNGFQSRTQDAYATYATALQNYYATLKTVPDSISQFNHPGTTFGDFSDFAHYDEEIDNLITLIEVGNGEGAIGSSGYFPSYEYYTRALDKGWHVAPTNNQDNHKGLWGDANTARSVVLADSLTEDNIYDAMRNYRVYATEDNDLSIYYTLDGNIMGSILESEQVGETIEIRAEISDPTDASIGRVEVIVNGGLSVASQEVAGTEEVVLFDIPSDYSYYYIRVIQSDGDIAVTAPVWVGEVEAVGINDMTTDAVLPVAGEALNVTVDLYNNEPVDLELLSMEFSIGDTVVHTADLETSELTRVASNSTASYTFSYTHPGVGSIDLNVTVTARLDGVEKIYRDVLPLTYVSPEMVTNVIVDGTHYNDYVTGYYGANMGNFTKIAAEKNIKVSIETEEITAEMLERCALLIVSAPAKRSGTANAGDYTPSHFEESFIQLVADYVANGGTVVLCGIADYQDRPGYYTSEEINSLLAAMNATMRLNSDEMYDVENNGGQAYRLYLDTFQETNRYMSGIVEGQTYSAYSGCSVDLTAALENDFVYAAEWLVKGHETTYSIDSKDAEGNSGDNSVVVPEGEVVALAVQETKAGGAIFLAGTVFVSDFEVEAELDNIWDLPYANRTIAENILEDVTVELPVTPIADARRGELGAVFAIEGYVTAGTAVEGNTFFDTIYVQDETGGITVFPFAQEGVAVGTKIHITGYIDEYQGDREIQILSYEILSGEAPVVYEPEDMSAADAMDYENNGGKLIRVTGEVLEVDYTEDQKGVSQYRVRDENGDIATVFIDGYILSATTGTNALASVVQVGSTVSSVGLLYLHPEGSSEESVPCLRVRNCDEIVLISEPDNPFPFTDVSEDDWYYAYVLGAYEAGLMIGVSDTQFAPGEPMTRAMAVTTLYRMYGSPQADGTSGFSDVEAGSYYECAVVWGVQNGIVNGYPDGTFRPDNAVLREELVVMLYRFGALCGADMTVSAGLESFVDASVVSDWALDAFQWAVGNGLICGNDIGQIKPRGVATRAECAKLFYLSNLLFDK